MIVGTDIIPEEITEIICDQTFYGRVRKVAVDERCKRCQETIRHRLTIDPLDDIGHCQTVFLFKL